MSTVSAAAETVFVSVRMMEGRAMSQSVVSAAQEQIKGQYAAVLGHIRQKTADQGAVFGVRVVGSFGHGNLFRLMIFAWEISR